MEAYYKSPLTIALYFVALPFVVHADELIVQSTFSSGEDLYLVDRSITRTKNPDIVWAGYYYSMHEPSESVEIFDGDANVIGHERFGLFQSYGYVGAFDCRRRLEATLAVQYYAGRTPHGAKVLKHENYLPIYEDDFVLPISAPLLNRVCELAGR